LPKKKLEVVIGTAESRFRNFTKDFPCHLRWRKPFKLLQK